MSLRAIVLVAAAVVAAAAAPVAEAEVRTFSAGTYEPVAAPVLAGKTVAWAGPLGAYGYRLYERAGQRTELLRSARGTQSRTLAPQLAASETVVGLQESILLASSPGVGGQRYAESNSFAKLAGQAALTPLGSCRGETLCPTGIGAAGSRVLFPIGDPANHAAGLRDVASATPMARVTDVGGSLRLAGAMAAWNTAANDAIVVYDFANQRELLRLSAPGPQDDLLDVQADGKVVFFAANRRLAWASPQEPYPHPVTGAGTGAYRVRVDSDAVTWLRDYKGGRAIFTARLGESPRLLVSGVKGQFDSDGSRVVWGGRSCRGATLSSETYARLLRRPLRQGNGCRLRLARRLRAGNSGTVGFVPRCAGLAPGCDIEVQSVRAARSYSAGGRRVRKGQRLATLSRSDFRGPSVSVRLTRAARSLLRQRRALRITVRAVVDTDRGAAELRRGNFVLHR